VPLRSLTADPDGRPAERAEHSGPGNKTIGLGGGLGDRTKPGRVRWLVPSECRQKSGNLGDTGISKNPQRKET
jgi:hypothetical protein